MKPISDEKREDLRKGTINKGGTKMKETDLELYFCPKCKEEEMSGRSTYCGRCGTKIKKVEMIVCMEGENIERLLLKPLRL